MSAARNGRQVYCVISDQLGNSIQTNTVTLSMGKELKITKQLASAAIHNGERVNVSFTATGDDITYKWYFKDASSKKFSYTKTFTGNTYSIEMSSSKNG